MARSTGGIGARRVGRLAALFGLCVGLAACSAPPPRVGWQGQTPVLASYAAGVLSTELPMGVGVHSTIAAARMTLERRGYTITATEATDDTGRVVARPGDPALMRKITITARLRTTGTSVSIRTDPGGNEQYERDVLERMLTLLGL
ncbi:MAG: hypothetical protein H6810_00880 [Phycisphaeraceae bacterium]|nr:MAG: hypothetical protein H6810_00880 [Phycisphaeraceae bacterium]